MSTGYIKVTTGAGGDSAVLPIGRTATLTVAASDSKNPTDADYQCDGVTDNVEIQAGVVALP